MQPLSNDSVQTPDRLSAAAVTDIDLGLRSPSRVPIYIGEKMCYVEEFKFG